MRFSKDIEHPDITYAMLTGCTPFESEPPCCERCGDELGEDMYEDFGHEYLCADCLLKLHKKEW